MGDEAQVAKRATSNKLLAAAAMCEAPTPSERGGHPRRSLTFRYSWPMEETLKRPALDKLGSQFNRLLHQRMNMISLLFADD